jgi:hypothetical protein
MNPFRRRWYVVLVGQPGGEYSWARPYFRKTTAHRRAESLNRAAIHPFMYYEVVEDLHLPGGRL